MYKHSFYALMMLPIFLFSACSEEEDEDPTPANGPWSEQFSFGNTVINGINVTTNQDFQSEDLLRDDVCFELLPENNFQSIQLSLYVPSGGSDYNAELSVEDMVIFYGGRSQPVSVGDKVDYLETVPINGVEYARFEVSGTYSGRDLDRESFQQLRCDFTVNYKREDEVVHTDDKAVVINIRTSSCDYLDDNSSTSGGSTSSTSSTSGGSTSGSTSSSSSSSTSSSSTSSSSTSGSTSSTSSTTQQVVFWTSSSRYGQIRVYVNNRFRGTITSYYTSGSPDCGDRGAVTVTITSSNNTWRAESTSGSYEWSDTFTASGSCTSMQLR